MLFLCCYKFFKNSLLLEQAACQPMIYPVSLTNSQHLSVFFSGVENGGKKLSYTRWSIRQVGGIK